jgi:hypothetical protein
MTEVSVSCFFTFIERGKGYMAFEGWDRRLLEFLVDLCI